eukprot:6371759-Pyramimonas_sp.AAC.1
MSSLNAGVRFKPGSSVGLSLMCAENGWHNDPLVIATSGAIHTYLVIMSIGTMTSSLVSALMVSALPSLEDPQAWLKCKSPIAALMLGLYRICWKLLDPFALLDDEGFSWDLKFYSVSWISHIVKLGVRRQIDRGALAAMQGAGSTRTGPISWQPISEALHGKRLSPHQRRSLRGVITGGHWTQ